MGTNYYLIQNKCCTCGRQDTLHIGKASYGWKFLFRANDNPDTHSIKDWRRILVDGCQIVDEYDRPVSADDFWKIVEARQSSPNCHHQHDPRHGYVDDGYEMTAREFC